MDDIIGSCNLTKFSIIKSTRVINFVGMETKTKVFYSQSRQLTFPIIKKKLNEDFIWECKF